MRVEAGEPLAMRSGNLLPSLGVALVLATIVAAGFVPWAVAPASIPPSGSVVLLRGQEVITQWVEVPAGSQAKWEWFEGHYIDFGVEARGIGLIDGGDQGAAQGCARAVEPFAIRMGFGHTAWPADSTPVTVNYRIVVEPGNQSCETVTEARQMRTIRPYSESLDTPPPLVAVIPWIAGNAAFGGLVWATHWPTRGLRRAERKRSMVEKERWLQERERAIEERVRVSRPPPP